MQACVDLLWERLGGKKKKYVKINTKKCKHMFTSFEEDKHKHKMQNTDWNSNPVYNFRHKFHLSESKSCIQSEKETKVGYLLCPKTINIMNLSTKFIVSSLAVELDVCQIASTYQLVFT